MMGGYKGVWIMGSIGVFSMNTRGLGSKEKRKQLFYWLNQKRENIFFLQETHSSPDSERIWYTEWGGCIIFSHGRGNARGVAILIKKNIEVTIHTIEGGQEGRYLIVDCTLNNFQLTLANIYAPNDDDPDYFLNIITIV